MVDVKHQKIMNKTNLGTTQPAMVWLKIIIIIKKNQKHLRKLSDWKECCVHYQLETKFCSFVWTWKSPTRKHDTWCL